MATLKQRLHRKSDSGTYDVVHLETSSDIVDFDGQTVHDALSSALSLANAANQEIPSLKSSVSEGKRQVASAITDKGVSTASDASFSTMAANIRKIDKIITGTPVLNKDFTYSGQCQVIDESTEAYNSWKIKFLTSGTLRFTANMNIDVFLVGGGGSGAGGGTTGSPSNRKSLPSAGGGGGYTKTIKNVNITKNTSYSIVVGAGGAIPTAARTAGNSGGSSSMSSISGASANGGNGGGNASATYKFVDGGNGGSGGSCGAYSSTGRGVPARASGGSNGNNGSGSIKSYNASTGESVNTVMQCGKAGTGQGSTTREFADGAGTLYSNGGKSGGYTKKTSGSGFVLIASTAPVANSGNGGDGGFGESLSDLTVPSAGSTGIVIIRNKR